MTHQTRDRNGFGAIADGPSPSDRSDYDALADLFLTDEAPVGRIRPAVSRPEPCDLVPSLPLTGESPAPVPSELRIEGLLLGHLPVLGAAWVMQYAKHLAEASRAPVALLRIQGGTASLDLVNPRGASPRASSRIGPGVGATPADLPGAIRHARTESTLWLVRVDETIEPDLLAAQGLSGITMLTGADDPAVVASYRTIKQLAQNDSATEPPPVRLAVMGADDSRAADAEAKLRRASEMFLGRDIEVVARIAKVGACSTQSLFRGPSPASLPAIIDLILAPHAEPTRAATAKLPQPSPATPATPAKSEPPAAPILDIAAHLGLTGLSTACPYAEGVVLAAGTNGELHLLAGSQGAGGSGTVQNAVQQLLTAAAWADDHAELLEAAHPGVLGPIRKSGPVLHALAADAKPCRGLLDTGIRAHLAQYVLVNGTPHWAVSALN